MKKIFVLLFLLGMVCACETEKKVSYPMVIAHRGCWLENVVPENSVAAVEMAKRYGYAGIECDVKYTADSVMVILHDATLNRTARLVDGYAKLESPVKVKDLTFEALRRDYVLASADPALRTPIPTLEELLLACRKHGMLPVLHSDLVESYTLAQEMMGDEWVAFTIHDSLLMEARKISNCLILMDPMRSKDQSAQETIKRLKRIGGKCGVSSMKRSLLTRSYCDSLRQQGFEIQSSIFQTPHEVEAVRNGVTILLTDFSLMPNTAANVLDTWSVCNQSMQAGDVLEKRWEKQHHGGITLELQFSGTIEVTMNEERTYTLKNPSEQGDCIGLRFLDKAPAIRIVAKEAAELHAIKATVYQF